MYQNNSLILNKMDTFNFDILILIQYVDLFFNNIIEIIIQVYMIYDYLIVKTYSILYSMSLNSQNLSLLSVSHLFIYMSLLCSLNFNHQHDL